jgi:hypothetical protein
VLTARSTKVAEMQSAIRTDSRWDGLQALSPNTLDCVDFPLITSFQYVR